MKGEDCMKKIMYSFAYILSVVALASCGSMPIAPTEDQSMRKVHAIDLTKNEIYDISLEWMAQSLTDYSETFELKNKDNGKIIGKGIISFYGKVTWGWQIIPCRVTMIVEAKDNTYRTTYTNFIGLWGRDYRKPKPLEKEENYEALKAKLAIIDDALYNYLKKFKSNSNW